LSLKEPEYFCDGAAPQAEERRKCGDTYVYANRQIIGRQWHRLMLKDKGGKPAMDGAHSDQLQSKTCLARLPRDIPETLSPSTLTDLSQLGTPGQVKCFGISRGD
jgi:hypothetical protein